MPAGLLRNTWPLLLMRPKIWLALPSRTRLSVTLAASGCLKVTLAPVPRLKLCQSMTARWLPCWMVMAAPAWPMLAWPATTLPPCGKVVAAGPAWASAAPAKPSASAAGSLRSAANRALPPRPLPLPLLRPRLRSCTAIQVPRTASQIRQK